MKKFTMQEISQMRADINNGTVYCGVRNGRGVGRIYKTSQDNIGFQHFGSSAIKNTDGQLKWLLETIFVECETVTPAVWSDRHINYVPIDKQYSGIDLSTKHPNTFGV